MRNEDERADVLLESDLQRLDGFHVHVVGRLVHQHHVGPRQDQLAVDHAALLAAGQHGHGLLGLVAGEQQATERGAHDLFVIGLAGPLRHPAEEVDAFGELGLRILRHVAGLSVLDPGDAACGRLQFAGEHAHQRGLADAVRADHGDTLARFDREVQVLENVLIRAGIAERQALDRHGRAVQLHLLLEADVRVLARRRTDLFDLDLLELLLARGGLARLRGVRREAPHEFLQVRDLVLGLRVRGLDALARLHGGEHEVVVVAGIDFQLLEIEVGDVGADLIQEMTIVTDDDHRCVVIVQRALEPADRVDVEVVGRLVEQQHVGRREQRLREQHAQLQAGRQFTHRAVVFVFVDARVDQDAAGARLGGIAAVLRELAFELSGFHVVGVRRVRVRIDAVPLLHRPPHLHVALHHHIQDALVFIAELVLVQLSEPHAGLQHDVARALLEVAAQDLHQRRLAAAVCTDQAIAIAIGELDGDLFKKRLGFELDTEILGDEHGFPGVGGRAGPLARAGDSSRARAPVSPRARLSV